jgi:hypothetical protein
MEPITSLLASQATDSAIGGIASMFKKHVVERWTRYRANAFFDEFKRAVHESNSQIPSHQLAEMLDELITNEMNSEILFDAYRSVCLSRSKDIGPRIIALVVAEVTLEERNLTEDEERMLLAAENLSDSELTEFYEFTQEQRSSVNKQDCDERIFRNGSLRIKWCTEQFDSNWPKTSETPIAPLNLATHIGSWAEKLSRYGLLIDDLTEKRWDYEEDGERHIDEPGSVREITWWIEIPVEGFKLADLIKKILDIRGLAA